MKQLDLNKHEGALRSAEASFGDDVMPAGYQPAAPREFYAASMPRALPRMHEQSPWAGIDDEGGGP